MYRVLPRRKRGRPTLHQGSGQGIGSSDIIRIDRDIPDTEVTDMSLTIQESSPDHVVQLQGQCGLPTQEPRVRRQSIRTRIECVLLL